jgi:hypothetical protein
MNRETVQTARAESNSRACISKSPGSAERRPPLIGRRLRGVPGNSPFHVRHRIGRPVVREQFAGDAFTGFARILRNVELCEPPRGP